VVGEWLARLDGERRRWTAAGVLVATTLGSGAAFSGNSLPVGTTRATAAEAGLAGAPAAPIRPFDPTTPPASSPIPLGKGMWLNNFDRSAGGDPHALVARAEELGLTHLYVRVGSSKKGFYAQPVLERLLPVAHAAGLKVVGWDFPTLADPAADAVRGRTEIWYTTSGGHRLDAFSADIETPAEGTRLSAGGALQYGSLLREAAGPGYPLIATVPRPSPKRSFPFAEVTASFDAIAPMVYWGARDPVNDVVGAIRDLAPLGKPILPVGQAYDSAIDGWKGGSPTKEALARFTQAAADHGALGVSFWVWETAEPQHWAAIGEASQFTLDPAAVAAGDHRTVKYLQRVLAGFGHPTIPDGVFGDSTKAALVGFQRLAGVPASGVLDDATMDRLAQPVRRPWG
jgi:peptidoglycan hydrolase-like protein with peptidoglycan-binding domain